MKVVKKQNTCFMFLFFFLISRDSMQLCVSFPLYKDKGKWAIVKSHYLNNLKKTVNLEMIYDLREIFLLKKKRFKNKIKEFNKKNHCHIFLHSFTFRLCGSLNLRWTPVDSI